MTNYVRTWNMYLQSWFSYKEEKFSNQEIKIVKSITSIDIYIFQNFLIICSMQLTEISAVVLNFLPRSKILNRPTVSTHYRIQKYLNKICLH